jgi:hypothetical protein
MDRPELDNSDYGDNESSWVEPAELESLVASGGQLHLSHGETLSESDDLEEK